MNWPLASDYQDAIQNPTYCFQDAALSAGQPVVTKLGLPRVASGTFASVYEMRNGAQRWAVRCFLRPSADQQTRYARLSTHLSTHRLPGMVDFAYEAQGIRVRGQWYPIVKMEWVEGITLHTYISSHIGDVVALRKLAMQWRRLLENLRRNEIAHADLQHGNVLVTPDGALRLVDYDGMYVPGLHGEPSHELGHANYQHPQRAAADYDAGLDNFSALVIYTSLIALIYDPTLWKRFHTGENLIFSAADFKAPQKSVLFECLYRSSEPLVRKLAEYLIKACEGPVGSVTDFLTILTTFPDIPEPKPWWQDTPPVVAAHPAQPSVSAAKSKSVIPRTPSIAVQKPLKQNVPAEEEEATLPEWLQKDKSGQVHQATQSVATAPQSVTPEEQRKGRWLTCSGLSCLLLSLTLYGVVMLGSFLLRVLTVAAAHTETTATRLAPMKAAPPTAPPTSFTSPRSAASPAEQSFDTK